MKILVSCLSKSWGGMEMFALNSSLKLKENGINISLLTLFNSKLHLEAKKNNLPFFTIKGGSYFHPLQIIKTARLINNNNFNLIHSHASKDLWTIVPALKLLSKRNLPLFITKHIGSGVVKKDFLHNFLYKRVTKALAISQSIKQNIIETTCIKEKNVILFHNGVNIKNFNPQNANPNKLKNEFKIDDNKILIGMLGRMSPGKGHEEFIEAASIICKQFNNLLFVIVGEASFGENEYEEKIRTLAKDKCENKIIFTGFRNDIPDILSSFDIFILPSHAEAFGIALIEAMSMELPSIATKSDGVLDIIIDKENGFFFEKKNVSELVEKIISLTKSEDERKRIGKNARKHILENFNIDNSIHKLLNLYKTEINQQ